MHLKRETQGAFLRFKRKRKITNAKIYEDKRDLYCSSLPVRIRSSTTAGQYDCFEMFKTIVLVLRIEVYSYCIAEHRVNSCQFVANQYDAIRCAMMSYEITRIYPVWTRCGHDEQRCCRKV